MRKPLEGVRVVDLTHVVAGPVASFTLGDLGAEVIKVEPPYRAAPAVATPPVAGAPDRPHNRVPLFNELNRSKLGIALDLSSGPGRDLLLRLVAVSDVVMENFSSRVLGNLRLEYEDLRAARPDIILVSMPAFGRSGPYRDRTAHGPGIDAMSGLSHLTGYGDGRPGKPGNFFCDYNAGLLAALATMAAVRHRRRTGEGQHVECAMLEGELQILGDALMDVTMNGRVRQPLGNRHPWMAPHGVYPCAGEDRWVALACRSDAEFAALCDVIERPELAHDPRYAALPARYRNQDALDALIGAWTRHRDEYEAMDALQRAGVAAGAVLDVGQLHADPQHVARRFFVPVAHPETGPAPLPRVAFRFARMSAEPERPAPCFAQHTDYVLRELLGMADAEVRELEQSGAVARDPRGSQEEGREVARK